MVAPIAAVASVGSLLATGVGMAASAAGAGVQAQAARQSGEAKASQFEFQSGIALRNRDIAKQNANYARWTGEVEAQRSGMKSGYEISVAKAAQGASNLDVNFGSAKQVRDSMHLIGEHDQQVIRSDASRRAYAYEMEAVTQKTQSDMYTKAAADSRAGADLGASASILGGVSSVASKWTQASSQFGSSSNNNAVMPSSAFMNNEWGW